jgi:hypothetical protein
MIGQDENRLLRTYEPALLGAYKSGDPVRIAAAAARHAPLQKGSPEMEQNFDPNPRHDKEPDYRPGWQKKSDELSSRYKQACADERRLEERFQKIERVYKAAMASGNRQRLTDLTAERAQCMHSLAESRMKVSTLRQLSGQGG